MNITPDTFKQYIKNLQDEAQLVSNTVREKGFKQFHRAMLMAGLAIYVCYFSLYLPPAKKMATLQKRINQAKTTAQYADTYKQLHERLAGVYVRLPPASQRDQWLTTKVVETMKADNIIADSIIPPEETERGGFAFQSIKVILVIKFSELLAWIEHVEATRPALHVSALSLQKSDVNPGENVVTADISTIIPIQQLGQ